MRVLEFIITPLTTSVRRVFAVWNVSYRLNDVKSVFCFLLIIVSSHANALDLHTVGYCIIAVRTSWPKMSFSIFSRKIVCPLVELLWDFSTRLQKKSTRGSISKHTFIVFCNKMSVAYTLRMRRVHEVKNEISSCAVINISTIKTRP